MVSMKNWDKLRYGKKRTGIRAKLHVATLVMMLILCVTMTTGLAFANDTFENDDIKINASSGMENVASFSTKWDNPNAWSLEDEVDIIKVIFTELYNENGKKVKNSSIDGNIRISIHIPEAYREGYEATDYQVVVFNGTDVREWIDVSVDGEWLSFSWNTIEDFGVVVKGASDGGAGVLTLVGSSYEKFKSVDFNHIFAIVGIVAAFAVPFMTIYAYRRVKKEMREEYEAEAKRLAEEEAEEDELYMLDEIEDMEENDFDAF